MIAAAGAATAAGGGVGIPLAVLAGLASFLSPCVLPLVPGYLSTVAGVSVSQLGEAGRRRLLLPSLLFIGGFSAVFVLMGLAATGVGQSLHAHLATLRVAGGALIVALGIAYLLSPFISLPAFQRQSARLLGWAANSSPLAIGAAFAVAWTPCTGATLGAILTQAAISHSAASGALLLACYSLGLALPFLALSLAFARIAGALGTIRHHFPLVIGAGGAVLIALGALILSGEFTLLNSEANSLLQGGGLAGI